jgi:hypothetical protein
VGLVVHGAKQLREEDAPDRSSKNDTSRALQGWGQRIRDWIAQAF